MGGGWASTHLSKTAFWVLWPVFLVRNFSRLPRNPHLQSSEQAATMPLLQRDTHQTSIQVAQWDLVHNEFMLGVGVGSVCLCLSMQFLSFVKINSKSLAPWGVCSLPDNLVSGASGHPLALEPLPQSSVLLPVSQTVFSPHPVLGCSVVWWSVHKEAVLFQAPCLACLVVPTPHRRPHSWLSSPKSDLVESDLMMQAAYGLDSEGPVDSFKGLPAVAVSAAIL